MAKRNHLTIGADGNGEGNYTSLEHNITFLFATNPDHKATDVNSPAYHVLLKTRDGGAFEAGAAWKKIVQDGPNKGSVFYSFSIDDPSFSAPLNLTAFCVKKPASKDDFAEYEVVWRRNRARDAA